MLRTSPSVGYNLGLGVSTGLEQANKMAVGATKKYLSTKVKEELPDPKKAHGN